MAQYTVKRANYLLRRLEISLVKMLMVYAYTNVAGDDATKLIRRIHQLQLQAIEAKRYLMDDITLAETAIKDITNFLLRIDV